MSKISTMPTPAAPPTPLDYRGVGSRREVQDYGRIIICDGWRLASGSDSGVTGFARIVITGGDGGLSCLVDHPELGVGDIASDRDRGSATSDQHTLCSTALDDDTCNKDIVSGADVATSGEIIQGGRTGRIAIAERKEFDQGDALGAVGSSSYHCA